MNTVVKGFILKALYGVAASVAAALLFLATNFHPEGSPLVVWAWKTFIVSALMGVAGAIEHWVADQSKGG